MHCLRLKNGAVISFSSAADLIRFVESAGDEELKKLNGLQKKSRPDLQAVPAGSGKSDENPETG